MLPLRNIPDRSYKGYGSDCEQKEIPVWQGFALIFSHSISCSAGGVWTTKTTTPPFSDCRNIAKYDHTSSRRGTPNYSVRDSVFLRFMTSGIRGLREKRFNRARSGLRCSRGNAGVFRRGILSPHRQESRLRTLTFVPIQAVSPRDRSRPASPA